MQAIELLQPAKGYRYNLDSMLLARFSQFREGERVCDLGAGVGVLAILALMRGNVAKATAIEVQEELASYIQLNSEKFSLGKKLNILCCNWKEVKKHLKAKSMDLVISNPPYRKLASGKPPLNPLKAIAKQEVMGNMQDLILNARFLMKTKGRFTLIYPSARLEDFIGEISRQKLKLQRLCFIHPFLNRPATHFMAEAVFSVAGEICIEKPLIIYRNENQYMPEIEAWLGSPKLKTL